MAGLSLCRGPLRAPQPCGGAWGVGGVQPVGAPAWAPSPVVGRTGGADQASVGAVCRAPPRFCFCGAYELRVGPDADGPRAQCRERDPKKGCAGRARGHGR
eukprot:1511583-Prymnesium_polylepis.1